MTPRFLAAYALDVAYHWLHRVASTLWHLRRRLVPPPPIEEPPVSPAGPGPETLAAMELTKRIRQEREYIEAGEHLRRALHRYSPKATTPEA